MGLKGRLQPSLDSSTAGSRGFTLIEVLMVMTLIGLLAGLTAPNLFSAVEKIQIQAEERKLAGLLGDVSYRAFVRNTPIRVLLGSQEVTVAGDAVLRFDYLRFPQTRLDFLASGFCDKESVPYRVADEERFIPLRGI